jgi:hypothetical protein
LLSQHYNKVIYKFDVIPQETETNGFMLASHEQIKEFAKTGNFLHYDSIKRVFE